MSLAATGTGKAMENILLIRLKSIGDVVLTLPAVHVVRQNFPSAQITFLTSQENAPLLEGFREVDKIIAIDRAALRSGNPLKVVPEGIGLLHRLRRGKFSLVVDFQGYGETAWLARWTGAPQRWGSVYNPDRRWAYTRGVTRNDNIQIADWNLSLLAQCGLKPGPVQNEFFLPDGALAAARGFFAAQKLDPAAPTLFIQPFTSSPHKNWPLDRYLAVARHGREHQWQILFGGGPAERAALEPARQAGFPVSAGVPILVTGGLMKLSSLILGGDTGALHLAVAMGKRVVMPRHSINPNSPHPFQHPDWVVIPEPGRDVSHIETPAVIAACVRAFAELGAAK
jgi:ADP-heptose:LPS heptosyltransferase